MSAIAKVTAIVSGKPGPRKRTASSKPGQFSCELCGKLFPAYYVLQVHMRSHTGEKPYKCSTCNKCFSRNDRLKDHQRRVHDGEKLFQCNICKQTFQDKKHLHNHTELHTLSSDLTAIPHKCEICRIAFKCVWSLANHFRSVHDPNYRTVAECVFCGREFLGTGNFLKHMATHTREHPHFCKICRTEWKTTCALKRHHQTHSAIGVKRFHCSICSRQFTHNFLLQNHLKTHTTTELVECDICGKTYPTLDLMKGHKRQIHGERRHSCNFCTKRFVMNRDLEGHMKRKHLKEKWHQSTERHECHICKKTFCEARSLQYHLRVHARIRPFKCELCGRSYISQGTLKQHQKMVHDSK